MSLIFLELFLSVFFKWLNESLVFIHVIVSILKRCPASTCHLLSEHILPLSVRSFKVLWHMLPVSSTSYACAEPLLATNKPSGQTKRPNLRALQERALSRGVAYPSPFLEGMLRLRSIKSMYISASNVVRVNCSMRRCRSRCRCRRQCWLTPADSRS